MAQERVFRLQDNTVIDDQSEIDRFLDERRAFIEERNATPPNIIIGSINLNNASLSVVRPEKIGLLEEVEIFELPNLIIDLTPESEDLPRAVVHFQLSDGSDNLLIEVEFDDTTGEYWSAFDRNDETNIFSVVQKNMQKILPSQQWETRGEGIWSAVE